MKTAVGVMGAVVLSLVACGNSSEGGETARQVGGSAPGTGGVLASAGGTVVAGAPSSGGTLTSLGGRSGEGGTITQGGATTSLGGRSSAGGSTSTGGVTSALGGSNNQAGSTSEAGTENQAGETSEAGNANQAGTTGDAGSTGEGGAAGEAGHTSTAGEAGQGNLGGTSGGGGEGAVGGEAGNAGSTNLDCPMLGHFVSKDTCGAVECGTIEQPYCTIEAGLANTPDQRVLVAGATTAYEESLVIVEEMTVEGGHDSAFSGARVLYGPGATQVLGGASLAGDAPIVLDGLEFLSFRDAAATGTIPEELSVLSLTATVVELRDLTVNLSLTEEQRATAVATTAFALRAAQPESGSLLIRGGSYAAPNATTRSIGLATRGSGSTTVDTGAVIRGGRAEASLGGEHASLGTLEVNDGTLASGRGLLHGYGILAEPDAEGTIPGAISADQATIWGDSDSLVEDEERVIGDHVGIVVRGVPLTVSRSQIIGAPGLEADHGVGILIEQNAESALPITISQNPLIDGGRATTGYSWMARALGIFGVGALDLSVTENEAIRGCSQPSADLAAGLFLVSNAYLLDPTTFGYFTLITGVEEQPAARWIIDQNTRIAGGPGDGGDDSEPHLGIDVYGSASNPELVVSNNTLIVGNDDPSTLSAGTYALRTRHGMDVLVENNHLLSADIADPTPNPGSGTSEGCAVEISRDIPPNTTHPPVTATIRNNLIETGRRDVPMGVELPTIGLLLQGVAAIAENNFVHNSGIAFYTHTDPGSVYRNNYFFGYTLGCSLGAMYSYGSISAMGSSFVTFVNNLCYGESRALGFVLLGSETERSLIANNILDVNPASVGRAPLTYLNGTPSSHVDLFNNALALYPEEVPNQDYSCLVASLSGGVGDDESLCRVFDPILGGNVTEANNLAWVPAYAAPDRANPTAEGFALDETCALRGLGTVVAGVTTDYFGELRDAEPEIGPDECLAAD